MNGIRRIQIIIILGVVNVGLILNVLGKMHNAQRFQMKLIMLAGNLIIKLPVRVILDAGGKMDMMIWEAGSFLSLIVISIVLV